MRRIISILLLIMVPVACCAQGKGKKSEPKPDLSGTWVLDAAHSVTGPSKKESITDYILTIEHREPEIKMSKKYKQGGREITDEVTYYTDGRPEYSSLRGVRDSEPITRWSGKKLIRKSVKEINGPVKLRAETEEEWSLSDDGQTLTRTVFSSGPGLTMKTKFVFIRRP